MDFLLTEGVQAVMPDKQCVVTNSNQDLYVESV